jgi:poly-gamma-glutamate synthase PgsB/CapB
LATLLFLLGLLVLLWSHEAWRHQRALRALPVRIHINGSRGKSSVTRLIAGALRESGMRTVAKTTGSKARLILTDGREEPILRLGTPNICEQIGVLDRARREGAHAIVMECMAVRPDLQRVTEEHIMHSTIGVITNVRPDHLDVMGPTVQDVAFHLSSTVPRGGIAILGDGRYAALVRQVAEARGSSLVVTDARDVPPGAMDGFTHVEHEENVATTLAVTRALGIDDTTAIRGMVKALPDIGACNRFHIDHKGSAIEFVNIFAANDLESTITLWQRLELGNPAHGTTFALLNLRGDRVDRSLQFAEAVETGLRADYYVLVGDFPDSVLRRFQQHVPQGRLVAMGREVPERIFDRISGFPLDGAPRARVGGVGNIGGLGHQILEYVSRSVVTDDTPLPAGRV